MPELVHLTGPPGPWTVPLLHGGASRLLQPAPLPSSRSSLRLGSRRHRVPGLLAPSTFPPQHPVAPFARKPLLRPGQQPGKPSEPSCLVSCSPPVVLSDVDVTAPSLGFHPSSWRPLPVAFVLFQSPPATHLCPPPPVDCKLGLIYRSSFAAEILLVGGACQKEWESERGWGATAVAGVKLRA